MILTCKCKHEFQDERYGADKRAHNQCAKGWRCTVCGGVKEKGQKGEREVCLPTITCARTVT